MANDTTNPVRSGWKPILEIIFKTHEEYLPKQPLDHEQSELYMYIAKRIAESQSRPASTPAEQKSYPGQQYQNLFNWLRDKSLISLQSEMDEVIDIIHRDFPAQPTSRYCRW
jgi:hypothetical protein